ncbi:MAG: PrsW family intramembrane metalloprotease, partial [Pseudomonadota bacterium]
MWLIWFAWKGRPGRFHNIAAVFALGCASTLPAAILEHVTEATVAQPSVLQSAAVSLLLIAPIEEFLKLCAVWVGIYRSDDFREPMDGILYSTTAALGFACIENLVYMGVMGPGIFVARVVLATPAHVMFSAMWGYSLGIARFRKRNEIATVARGLVLAIVLHGGYNSIVALRLTEVMISMLPLMILMGWMTIRRIKRFRVDFPFANLGKGALVCCP